MSKLITRINKVAFEVTKLPNGDFVFGDYNAGQPELARVMVYGQLDAALTANVSTEALTIFGSTGVTLADVEFLARGTVNGVPSSPQTTLPCFVCGQTTDLYVPNKVWERFMQGDPIQLAWPNAHHGTRELLISGTHPKCWDQLFGGEE